MPEGTLIIRAAEQLGIEIPRFCDHPLLEPAGACRQCYVEIEGQPQARDLVHERPVAPGMVVRSQNTSEVAHEAQVANLEFLLLNHPLDCPICDRGGECPLQDQALAFGPGESRYTEAKRTYAKPLPLSALVKLDRERCVLCARCTRFCDEISRRPVHRAVRARARASASRSRRARTSGRRSRGNTVQICPVGALTSSSYRFVARPFDLSTRRHRLSALQRGCNIKRRRPSRRGRSTAGARQPRRERRLALRQGAVRVPVPRRSRARHDAADPRARARARVVRRGAVTAIAAGARGGSRSSPAGGSSTRTTTRCRSSRAPCSAPTTSTIAALSRAATPSVEIAAAGGPMAVTYRDVERRARDPRRGPGRRAGDPDPAPSAAQGRPQRREDLGPASAADAPARRRRHTSRASPGTKRTCCFGSAARGRRARAGAGGRRASRGRRDPVSGSPASRLGARWPPTSPCRSPSGAEGDSRWSRGARTTAEPCAPACIRRSCPVAEASARTRPNARRSRDRGARFRTAERGRDARAILEAAPTREIDVLFLIGVDPLRDFPDAALARRALENVTQGGAISRARLAGAVRRRVPSRRRVRREGRSLHHLGGQGQRLHPVRGPQGIALPDWEIFARLALSRSAATWDSRSLEGLQDEMGPLLAPREAAATAGRRVSHRGHGTGSRRRPASCYLFTYPLLVDEGLLSEWRGRAEGGARRSRRSPSSIPRTPASSGSPTAGARSAHRCRRGRAACPRHGPHRDGRGLRSLQPARACRRTRCCPAPFQTAVDPGAASRRPAGRRRQPAAPVGSDA